MKLCVIIPCRNHADTLGDVVSEALATASKPPILIIDDASMPPLQDFGKNTRLLRLSSSFGKAAALRAGFDLALSLGFTHAVTMDADGQHPPRYLDDFAAACQENPNCIIVGARDFENSSIPAARKFLNKFSNFWYRVETGVRVDDTQCGFRCYPLAVVNSLNVSLGGFAYEVELLVKAAWAGFKIKQIKIPAIYDDKSLSGSHYRPIIDTLKFTMMNTRLFFTRIFTTSGMRKKIALSK